MFEGLLASPLQPSCTTCRTKMQLAAIAPHPEYGGAFEIHRFTCESCGRTQNYTLRRDHVMDPANVRPRGDRRFRRVR